MGMSRLLKKSYILLLVLMLFAVPRTAGLAEIASGEYSVTLYSYQIPAEGEFILSGGMVITRHSKQDFLQIKDERSYFGISLHYSGAEDADSLMAAFGAREVFRQHIADRQIIYAYTPKIKDYVTIDGRRINLQIAADGQSVTVGSPLIAGGY